MIARKILNRGFGKLFLKTISLNSDWNITTFNTPDKDITYTFVDNITNQIIKQGVKTTISTDKIKADLSQGNGDTSLYLDVDDNGNGINDIRFWYTHAELSYIDTDMFPKLTSFWINSGLNVETQINGDFYNLQVFIAYFTKFKGLNLINTTKLKLIRISGICEADIPLDISNNADLEEYAVTGFVSIQNFSLFPKLKIINFSNSSLENIPTYINNDVSPNLYYFKINASNAIWDTNNLNLSNLSYVYANIKKILDINDLRHINEIHYTAHDNIDSIILEDFQTKRFYLNIGTNASIESLTIGDNNLFNTFYIYGLNNISQENLDLTKLLNLTSFLTAYTNFGNLQNILVNNGLNEKIRRFSNLHNSIDWNVKVDNPTDANNGISPYTTNIWRPYKNHPFNFY